MRLAPEDITKQTFQVTMRGYNTTEVDTYLKVIGDDYASLVKENKKLKQEAQQALGQLDKLKEYEEAIKKAADIVSRTTEEAVANGRRQAELIVEQARLEASKVKHAAELEASEIKSGAEARISDLMSKIELLQQTRVNAYQEIIRTIDGVKANLAALSAEKE